MGNSKCTVCSKEFKSDTNQSECDSCRYKREHSQDMDKRQLLDNEKNRQSKEKEEKQKIDSGEKIQLAKIQSEENKAIAKCEGETVQKLAKCDEEIKKSHDKMMMQVLQIYATLPKNERDAYWEKMSEMMYKPKQLSIKANQEP